MAAKGASLAAAVRAGNAQAVAASARRIESSVQEPDSPVWLLVKQMKHAPASPDYPWGPMLAAFHAIGLPADTWLEPSWKSKHTAVFRDKFNMGIGRARQRRFIDSHGATLLQYAVGLGSLPAVRALLASPLASARQELEDAPDRAYACPWFTLDAEDLGTASQIMDMLPPRLPASMKTVGWLSAPSTAPLLAPDSLVWAALPSGPDWLKKVFAVVDGEISTSDANFLASWWLARPADRKDIAAAAVGAGQSLWPALVIASMKSPESGLLAQARDLCRQTDMPDPALDFTTFMPTVGCFRRRQLRVPVRQWLRHQRDVDVAAALSRTYAQNDWHSCARIASEAEGLARKIDWQQDWIGHHAGRYTEAELYAAGAHSVARHADTLPWSDQDWTAPGPVSGRTPLWHATRPEDVRTWIERGCSLHHVDAAGDQAFAWLLAQTALGNIEQDKPDMEIMLAGWLDAGLAPTVGTAMGLPASFWASLVPPVSRAFSAAATRAGNAASGLRVLDPDQRLLSACLLADQSGVDRALALGADCNRRREQPFMATPLLAALTAPCHGKSRQRRVLAVVKALLDAGAVYAQPDTLTPLDRFLVNVSFSNSRYGNDQDLFVYLLAAHQRAGAPWSLNMVKTVFNKVDAMELWPVVSPAIMTAWLAAVMDPSVVPDRTDTSLANHVEWLQYSVPRLCSASPGTNDFMSAWQAIAAADEYPLTRKALEAWRAYEPYERLDAARMRAWWAAQDLAMTHTAAPPPASRPVRNRL